MHCSLCTVSVLAALERKELLSPEQSTLPAFLSPRNPTAVGRHRVVLPAPHLRAPPGLLEERSVDADSRPPPHRACATVHI